MSFKRYDSYFACGIQRKFDRKLKICPFCEQKSFWLLDIDPSYWQTEVTAMCDKCDARISTTYTLFCGNNLKVVNVGKANVNKISLGEYYTFKKLKALTIK